MCGFIGFTGKIENSDKIIRKMMDRIVHRGPDMGDCYVDEHIALGFRRLSILDLSEAGKQPMQSEDGNYVITYNGEVYNFLQLKEQLEALGHTFKSGTDTEVVLHGYMQYGAEIVKMLRGMYAFVIYDKAKNEVFGARDIFGIKPFYYHKVKNSDITLFSSEIKCFLDFPGFEKQINEEAILPYLTLQYSATEQTFFKDVYKLPAAHYFTLKDGVIDVHRYWDADFAPKEQSFDECVNALHETVKESVKAHQIADVKVGSFLSGGVDSSYIAAAQMPDNTFSVGFEQHKFNETNYAKELSDILGIKNYRKLITAKECFDAFPTIQYHMDEPQANPSSVPLYFLAQMAREHVTVVLSGEGADEIFAGYEWYADTPAVVKFKKSVPLFARKTFGAIADKMPYFKGKNFLLKSSEQPEDYFVGQAKVFEENEAKSILKPEFKNGHSVKSLAAKIYDRVKGKDEVTKKQYLDMNMWLPGDILLKADKMCMAHSLELRVPFLDKVIMDFATTVPVDYRIKGTDTKIVMRAASNKILPDDWANRPKKGFPVPIKFWLREPEFYNIVKEYFTQDYAERFFDKEAICKLLNDHFEEKADNQRKIWVVFTFLTWYKRFFIDENV